MCCSDFNIVISYELLAILIASTIQIVVIVISINQFKKIFTQSDNIEFVKQLTYFEEEFDKIFTEYVDSPHYVGNCRMYANKWLLLLERMCFIFDKEIINDDFIEFFSLRIDMGKRFLNWNQLIARDREDVTETFPYFLKHYSKSILKDDIELENNFIFFFYTYRKLGRWDVTTDTTTINDWVIPNDYRKSDYYDLLHMDPIKLIKTVQENPSSIYSYP